jgi:hypothetical protein
MHYAKISKNAIGLLNLPKNKPAAAKLNKPIKASAEERFKNLFDVSITNSGKAK